MSQQKVDIYAPIPFKSKEISQSKATTTFSSSAPFTPSFVISSLSQSSDPTALYNARVKGRQMLLENPAKESKLKREADRKKELRKKEKAQRQLGIIGRRKRELWSFDKSSIKYSSLLPLHHLWLGYMSELLNLPQPPSAGISAASIAKQAPASSSVHPKLLKADFHGAFLIVKNARNPCLVGLQGIIVHETENAFKVVTENDRVKLLPKQNSIFTFAVPVFSTLPASFKPGAPYPLPPLGTRDESTQGQTVHGSMRSPLPSANQTVTTVPHLNFELYGNQFRFRSTDRAGRKFKHKETIEL
ncbi:Rof/RNase P-like protein [Coprinopsis sp. MPI-PUGE-AT-0042]|nr:Rof/RNase P-like protein [Coprinopsis sp. MPI-PUGE-AT-0042]